MLWLASQPKCLAQRSHLNTLNSFSPIFLLFMDEDAMALDEPAPSLVHSPSWVRPQLRLENAFRLGVRAHYGEFWALLGSLFDLKFLIKYYLFGANEFMCKVIKVKSREQSSTPLYALIFIFCWYDLFFLSLLFFSRMRTCIWHTFFMQHSNIFHILSTKIRNFLHHS